MLLGDDNDKSKGTFIHDCMPILNRPVSTRWRGWAGSILHIYNTAVVQGVHGIERHDVLAACSTPEQHSCDSTRQQYAVSTPPTA